MKKHIISLGVTLVVAMIAYYFTLPAMNIQSIGFWAFALTLLAVFSFMELCLSVDEKGKFNSSVKVLVGSVSLILVIFVVVLVINIALSPMFTSKEYSRRITINEEGVFAEDVKPVDFSKLPLLDKASSRKIGDRVMGQMPELVSQFYVSDLYTQINYNDKIVRVTPLEYADFFKFMANRKDGVKGYIMVDSVSGESSLVKLDKGMKYMDSAIFNKDLNRHLRFSYPTKVFGPKAFEIDDEGNPFWIVPTLKFKGVGLRREVASVIVLDPITGKSKEYSLDKVPKWVDHVYNADLIIDQVNDWGRYKDGFLNSIFGQRNVVMTTEGYNYLAMNGDLYLYTGITSVSTDESNIGFILSNLRTKTTHFYAAPGAEEYSAMASAKGQVQQMNYDASFPLLINLNSRPTYVLSLKDKAGLVKMYAFVDVEDYQRVVITDSARGIERAAESYLESFKTVESDETIRKEIRIRNITNAVIDGNTFYYIEDYSGQRYRASIKVGREVLPFVKHNDTITISYNQERDLIDIGKVE